MALFHAIFNGYTRRLKGYYRPDAPRPGVTVPAFLRFDVECHDVGVDDGQLADPYGHHCKCPPGDYGIGAPLHLNPPEPPYGRWFIPLVDTHGAEAAHGRDGIGIHGGGSDLPDPFAPNQGWEYTYGCFRLQNDVLETVVVPALQDALLHGAQMVLTVVQVPPGDPYTAR